MIRYIARAAFVIVSLSVVGWIALAAMPRRADAGAQATVPGCSPARPHASGTSSESIVTLDGTRTYLLHVPPSYTGSAAVPVVFAMHSATSSASFMESYSGFSTKADAEGFIVVYPEGIATAARNFSHFNAWQLASPEPDDVAFISGILDTLEADLCIDAERVFATGYSNGAMLSVRLACSLSGRIAAVAPVAAAYYPPDALDLNASETCPDTAPVPFIAFHGTSDAFVPFNGGLGGFPGFMLTFRLPLDNTTAAEDVLADWSAHNACTGDRQESQVDTEVRLIEYNACAGGATAQLYVVDGGGHTWPGAVNIPNLGYTTAQISATDLIWAFFVAHAPGATPESVGGIAERPDLAAPPASAANPQRGSGYLLGAAVLVVVAVGAGGWYARRMRAHR